MFLMAMITMLVSAISFPATASVEGIVTEVVAKPKPKKGKKGFNYGAHAKKNKKAGQQASKKMKRSGGDLTRYKCGR